MPNWTSADFVAFVDTIGWFTDELWREDSAFVPRQETRTLVEDKETGREMRLRGLCSLWEEVLEVERLFWPAVAA